MASTIKVDNVQNQPGTNIINKCGTTITLGASSDTVALAAGATQTGFGRTGTVDWETSIQTGTVTAATGKGYFVDTTSGGITVNLPVGAVGSIVAISDYASTSASNNIIIAPNGSEKINGVNDDYTISTAGLAVTLVYADATRGWKSVTGSDADATGVAPAWVTATGGTPCAGATCGDYKIHTFTGPGTLCVSNAGNAGGNNSVEYVVVAGGGSGGAGDGTHGGGGGGAGGFRFASPSLAPLCYPAKPLAGATITAAVQGYPITVGAGAAGGTGCTVNRGLNSIFSTITSTGGGSGANDNNTSPGALALPGGSGGASGVDSGGPSPRPAGTGNTPVVSPPQGQPGGTGALSGGDSYGGAGGGGGTMVAGSLAPPSPTSQGGAGGAGAGVPTAFGSNGQPCGSFRYYGGGGGGGSHQGVVSASAPGGVGGGGASNNSGGVAGTTNTGGGGGSTPPSSAGATGGSGVVIIRYKFQ